MKKKLINLCCVKDCFTLKRDMRELTRSGLSKIYDVEHVNIFDDWAMVYAQHCNHPSYAFEFFLDTVLTKVHHSKCDGIISSCDYPTNCLRSLIAQKLNLPGPSVKTVLSLEHKYAARCFQQHICPESVPIYQIANAASDADDCMVPFPLFLKPIKSSFSRNAYIVRNKKELTEILTHCTWSADFLAIFNLLVQQYTPYEHDGSWLLLEELLTGYQTSVEGFVFEHEVTILGIVDALLFAGTCSFKCFEYPTSLDSAIQERMLAISKKIIGASGLNNSLFSVEFMYNPESDAIHIIEINPRMSSQFADLFERVDGINTYHIAAALALGMKPKILQKRGQFAVAASFVLRSFSDYYVVAVPSQENLQKIYELFPDSIVEIHAKVGKRLSDQPQDRYSYRYGLVHLGGLDRQDLLQRFAICESLLEFKFS